MKNGQKTRIGILVIIVILAVAGGIGYQYYQSKHHMQVLMNQRIFFYGKECPHCQLVEDFMSKNALSPQAPIVMKEVFHDRVNVRDYVRIAKYCGILETSKQGYRVEVPMLWTGKKCINGDLPIIQYLQTKAHLNNMGIKKS